MKIKTVLFDLDDTLTDTRKLYNIALYKCADVFNESTGKNLNDKEFRELYLAARKDFKAVAPNTPTSHNRAVYFQKLIENLDYKVDYNLAYKLYRTYYDEIYDRMVLFPGTEALLKWIKESGRKIGIVSDGSSHIRLEKINVLKVGKYLDFVVSSEEVGVDKPSKQPIMLALEKADCSAEESIFIGNKESADMLAAKHMHIVSIRVSIVDYAEDTTPEPKDDADFVVKSRADIKGIIEKVEAAQ
ncbi:HAD-IA family hydrolase [Candidatus Dojkabacteria bacterium]|nr:HAD-IA family hydrolase [Candidatus Dojkabacteria bacterium]